MTADDRTADDRTAEVAAAVARASRRFRSHGGGVALRAVTDDAVEVAFTGFCTGCACRPQCLMATVEPVVLGVPGVRRVDAVGVRLDDQSRARLDAFLTGAGPTGGTA